jgi:hypothetical protein
VSLPLSIHLGNTTNSTQGFPIAASVPPSSRQADINMHVHTAGLRSCALSLGSAFKVESSELPTPSNNGPGWGRDVICLTSTNKCHKPETRKGKGPSVPTRQPHIPVHRSTTRWKCLQRSVTLLRVLRHCHCLHQLQYCTISIYSVVTHHGRVYRNRNVVNVTHHRGLCQKHKLVTVAGLG